MGTSVVVTGAGGYVGPHVVRALAELGHRPVAVVRSTPSEALDPRAAVVRADVLEDTFTLADHVDPRDIAAVIHLAWQDGFVHNSPSHMEHLSAHFRFLTRTASLGVPRIAALGTMHEVGYWEGAITADSPTNPLTLYGIAKDALRRAAMQSIQPPTELVWLRAFYILGDDRRNRSVFAKILEASDRGDTEFPFTTGATLYDFIDVTELGRQIAVAATTPGLTGVVNTASGRPESLASRAERFIQEHELDMRLVYGAFPDRPYDSPGIWGDAAQIAEVMARSPFGKETP